MSVRLLVKKAEKGEVYRGLARINAIDRRTASGNEIPESLVFQIRHRQASILAWARGYEDEPGVIVLDDLQRQKLGVVSGKEYEFELDNGSPFSSLKWAFNHPDPIYRVSAVLGTISVALGLISVVLAIAIPIIQRFLP